MRTPFERRCQRCASPYRTRKPTQRYCSRRCYVLSQRRLPDRACLQCGRTFRPLAKAQQRCSKLCACRWTASHRLTTKGRYVTTKGYVLVYRPNHPKATKMGYIMEHRLVMENKIGRHLRRDEVVHHLDGNRANNALENLRMMQKRKHDSEGNRGRVHLVACPKCGHQFRTRGNARYMMSR